MVEGNNLSLLGDLTSRTMRFITRARTRYRRAETVIPTEECKSTPRV